MGNGSPRVEKIVCSPEGRKEQAHAVTLSIERPIVQFRKGMIDTVYHQTQWLRKPLPGKTRPSANMEHGTDWRDYKRVYASFFVHFMSPWRPDVQESSSSRGRWWLIYPCSWRLMCRRQNDHQETEVEGHWNWSWIPTYGKSCLQPWGEDRRISGSTWVSKPGITGKPASDKMEDQDGTRDWPLTLTHIPTYTKINKN